MTDGSAGAGETLRDDRRPPFCYQTHGALDAIRSQVFGAKRAAVLGVYLVLTEWANRNGGVEARSGFRAARKELADAAGVSAATLDRHVATLEKAGVLTIERQREGKSHLPNRWILVEPRTKDSVPPSADSEERGVAAKSVHKALEQEPSLEQEGSSADLDVFASAAPRPPNPLWDVLVEIHGDVLPRYRRARGRIVADLRELLVADGIRDAARAVSEVRRRHDALVREWGEAKATARALVQNWVLAGKIADGAARPAEKPQARRFGRGVTTREVLQAAERMDDGDDEDRPALPS